MSTIGQALKLKPGMLGLLSGYYGGKVDIIIMRILDGILGFPPIILALAIISALGPNIVNTTMAIGIVFITVSFKAIKAALANPVKSLRTE